MVKPGVYTVNKKQLKDGEKTTEYVHVEVQPLPPKPDTIVRDKKGRCCMKILGIVLFMCVLVGIAVGITYAIRWGEDGHHGGPEWPEGGDVIYPSEEYPWDQDRPNDHDGHHGDHPGHHDGHPDGPHDGHHGNHPHHPPEDGDYDSPVATERPPPIDYIGTPPPLIGRPGDGHDEHGHGNDDDGDHDGRPDHDDDDQHDGRPDHDDDGDHDGRPDHDDDGDHDGRPDHDDDGPADGHNGRPDHDDDGDHDGPPDHDDDGDHDGRPDQDDDGPTDGHNGRPGQDHDDDGYHRNIIHPPFRGLNQWQARRAQQHREKTRVNSQANRFANQGRSRVEIEEARHGGDYGHSRRMKNEGRQ